jgi:hypothetical protein
MKITTKLTIATAFAALAACSSNTANNMAYENSAEMNAGLPEMNAPMEMNATGNAELNAGATETTNAYGNETVNNTM